MSELTEAFRELQGEFDAVLGEAQSVKIDGKTVAAIIEDVESDIVMAAGGDGDAGGFRAMVACSDCPAPKQGAQVEARGQVFDLLSVVNTNGVTWTLVCGSAAIE